MDVPKPAEANGLLSLQHLATVFQLGLNWHLDITSK